MGYSDDVLATSGLVVYYKFDETSGVLCNNAEGTTSYNGSYTAVTLNQASILAGEPTGKSIYLNAGATNRYVTVPAAVKGYLHSAAVTAISVELWIKLDAISGSQYLFTLRNSSSELFQLYINADGSLTFKARPRTAESLQTLTSDASAFTAGTTYHVVCVADFSGDTMEIFKNGASIKQASKSFTNSTFSDSVSTASYVGNAQTTAAANVPDGYLDNFALYETALSSETILSHYNVGIGGAGETTYAVPSLSTSLALAPPVQIPATPSTISATVTTNNPSAKVIAESDTVSPAITLYDPIFTPWIKIISNTIGSVVTAYAPLKLPVTPDFETTAIELFDPITNPLLIGAPDTLSLSLNSPVYARVGGDVWYYETEAIAKVGSTIPAVFTLYAPVGGGGSCATGVAYSCRIDTSGVVTISELPMTGSTLSYIPTVTSTMESEVAGESSTATIVPTTSGSIAFEYLLTGVTQ